MISHPRVQQYRYLGRCAALAVAALVAAVAALGALAAGIAAAGVVLLVAAAGFGALSHKSLLLARRSRVGADAEDAVRRVLGALVREGWTVEHGVRWPGGGDIDHLVRSPSGLGFAVETKTRSFNERQLARTLHTARWAAGRRQHFPHGVIPVLCVVRSRGLQHNYDKVLVVSLDRIGSALRKTAAQVQITAENSARRAGSRIP
jgi:hypothetical protein